MSTPTDERAIRTYGAAFARAIGIGYCTSAARAMARMARREAAEQPDLTPNQIANCIVPDMHASATRKRNTP